MSSRILGLIVRLLCMAEMAWTKSQRPQRLRFRSWQMAKSIHTRLIRGDWASQRHSLAISRGEPPEENAEMTLSVLRGEKGTKRDIVLLNAAAAIVAGGKAEDITAGTRSGSRICRFRAGVGEVRGVKGEIK